MDNGIHYFVIMTMMTYNVVPQQAHECDGLVQDYRNFIANAPELQ